MSDPEYPWIKPVSPADLKEFLKAPKVVFARKPMMAFLKLIRERNRKILLDNVGKIEGRK